MHGLEVSDVEIAQWVEAAEASYDVEDLKPRMGRPVRGAEASQVVPVRLTAEELVAVMARAGREHLNRSEVIRAALGARGVSVRRSMRSDAASAAWNDRLVESQRLALDGGVWRALGGPTAGVCGRLPTLSFSARLVAWGAGLPEQLSSRGCRGLCIATRLALCKEH